LIVMVALVLICWCLLLSFAAQDRHILSLPADEETADSQLEEAEHHNSVLRCFRTYHSAMIKEVTKRQIAFDMLPTQHKARIPAPSAQKFQMMKKMVETNQRFFNLIVNANPPWGIPYESASPELASKLLRLQLAKNDTDANGLQMFTPTGETNLNEGRDKVIGTLHQIYRDWTAEGAEERSQSYGRILRELQRLKPVTPRNRNLQKVLIPGVGMGRLMLESCLAGYSTQGNDFCLQFLLTSNLIFNGGFSPNKFSIFPWIDDPSNRWRLLDLVQPVRFPDIDINNLLDKAREQAENQGATEIQPSMSMAAGEWLSIYSRPEHHEAWDAVITSFFIDTAANPIEYLELIYKCLKPGGIWINFGPLKYHWQRQINPELDQSHLDSRYAESVELSLDEILYAANDIGFEMIMGPSRHICRYASSPGSMAANIYDAAFFSMRKPLRQQ